MLMNRRHTETRPTLCRHAGRFIPGAGGLLFQTPRSGSAGFSTVAPVFHETQLSKVARSVTETVQRHAAEWARAESVPDLYRDVTDGRAGPCPTPRTAAKAELADASYPAGFESARAGRNPGTRLFV
jgi:hypothetical protein